MERKPLWLTRVQYRKKKKRTRPRVHERLLSAPPVTKVASSVKNIFVFHFPLLFALTFEQPQFIIAQLVKMGAVCSPAGEFRELFQRFTIFSLARWTGMRVFRSLHLLDGYSFHRQLFIGNWLNVIRKQ